MDKITVIAVDDHPLFRQGVVDALSLEEDIEVIAQTANGNDAINLIHQHLPKIAIVDVSIPGINGLQVTRQVSSEKLNTRVILLTGYDDLDQILHAAIAGACSYCSKDIEPGKLSGIVRDVARGMYVINGQVFTKREFEAWLEKQMEVSRRSYSEPGSPFHPLSDREMEVLECVVKGMSNKEIAMLLQISHQTVKNHVTSILRKFDVEDRTQAVVYALKHGWVKLSIDKPEELQV